MHEYTNGELSTAKQPLFTVQVLGKGAFGTVYHAEDGAKQSFACKSISKAKLITEVRRGLLWQTGAQPYVHTAL